MSEIFLSHSPFDSKAALALTERLRSRGADVWLAQLPTEGDPHRGAKIIDHIDKCTTFLQILSVDSIESDDVLKELAIAHEQDKRIIPIELDPVLLPTSFYYIKDLPRVAIADTEAILNAVQNGLSRVHEKENRASLIVLPFEDLSPSDDNNNWFGDGLTAEIIEALSQIKSLRILDRSTSMRLRGSTLTKSEIGKEFDTRYLIEGSVVKFGVEIDISVSLLDLETNKQLWRQSHHGEFKDIFGIQEAVAEKVIAALKLHLSKTEESLLHDRGTQNTEAYELVMKALVYFRRQTKAGFTLARKLFTDAIQLDPAYAAAYQAQALTLASLYRDYDRNPALLDEGLRLVDEALRLKPDLWKSYHPMSVLYRLQGKFDEAERAANAFVEHAPEDPMSHFALAFFFTGIDQPSRAIAPYEKFLKLRRGDIISLWNLVITCDLAGDFVKMRYWARLAVPRYEQYLRMYPDSEDTRVGHAQLLLYAGKEDEARLAVRQLDKVTDAMCLYNIACLNSGLKDHQAGIQTMRKAIEAGLRNTDLLQHFMKDDKWGILQLAGTPEYEEFGKMIDAINKGDSSNPV